MWTGLEYITYMSSFIIYKPRNNIQISLSYTNTSIKNHGSK